MQANLVADFIGVKLDRGAQRIAHRQARYAPSARASGVSGAEGAGPNWRIRFRTPGQSMLAGRAENAAGGRRADVDAFGRTVAGR